MNPLVRNAMCFVLVWTRGAARLRQMDDAQFRFVERGAMLTIFVPAMLVLSFSSIIPSPFADCAVGLAVLWGTVSVVKVLRVLAAEKVRRASRAR